MLNIIMLSCIFYELLTLNLPLICNVLVSCFYRLANNSGLFRVAAKCSISTYMIDTVEEYSPEQKIHWSHYIKYVNITILQALLYKWQIVQYDQ